MMGRHMSGAVLAGGANTRFGGRPKGLMVLDGRRLIDRVLDALRPVVDETFIVANDPRRCLTSSDVPVYRDLRPERASLVGLHSALTHSRDGAIVVAWDMPFVASSLLAHLRDSAATACAPVIPVGPRGPEALCAYYPRSVLPILERQLDAGELRLSAFVAALPAPLLLSPHVVSRFGVPDIMFANINSALDLEVARDLAVTSQLERQ